MLELVKYIEFLKKELSLAGAPKNELNKLNFVKNVTIYISKNEVNGKIEDIIQLVDKSTGCSEYKIINDCESDNRELWVEYDDDIALNPGDFLIKMK